jgi:uncharacterized membrane protein YagU involved in acid resistance
VKTTTILLGAAAGLAATAPMTMAMHALKGRLPWYQRYALPPMEVVARASHAVGLHRSASLAEHKRLATALHYGFGAACGAIYAGLAAPFRLTGPLTGLLFGMVVWTVSYLGWLPALGLFRSPGDQEQRRNLMMVVAHLVWGATLGAIVGAGDRPSYDR